VITGASAGIGRAFTQITPEEFRRVTEVACAHGEFDDRSHARSAQEWASERAEQAGSVLTRAAAAIRRGQPGQ